jgi:hypothetical protein
VFRDVHDSEIVAYSVDARIREVVLVVGPGTGSRAQEFKLVFRGVIAHQFVYPELPSIVFSLEKVLAADIVRKEWADFAEGSRQCGWPGSWAASLEAALAYCNAENINGYELSASYGMSGWLLAKSVERINAP